MHYSKKCLTQIYRALYGEGKESSYQNLEQYLIYNALHQKVRIVSNSASSGEQWQIVANSDEQSSIVTALDLISRVN